MQTDLIITDDFYTHPDETRAWVLKQPFDVSGNFPGKRTKPTAWPGLKTSIQDIVRTAGGEITDWQMGYTTAFQYTTAEDDSWIHSDHATDWAGVCYLTPDAPVGSGTGIFRHKETGIERPPRMADGSLDEAWLSEHCHPNARDYSKWDMTAMVGNVYNRLVLYRGDMFHRSLEYFGKDKHDGRLFQTFFFNTEH